MWKKLGYYLHRDAAPLAQFFVASPSLSGVFVNDFNANTCTVLGKALAADKFYQARSPYKGVTLLGQKPPKEEIVPLMFRGAPGVRDLGGRREGDYGRFTIPMSDAQNLADLDEFVAQSYFANQPTRMWRHVMGMTEVQSLSERPEVCLAFALAKAGKHGTALVSRVDPTGSSMHASVYPAAIQGGDQEAIVGNAYQAEQGTPGVTMGRYMGFTVFALDSEGMIDPRACFTVHSPLDAGIRRFLLANKGPEGVKLVHAYDQAARIAMAKYAIANHNLDVALSKNASRDELVELQGRVDDAYEQLLSVEANIRKDMHEMMQQAEVSGDNTFAPQAQINPVGVDVLAKEHTWLEAATCAAAGTFVNPDGAPISLETDDETHVRVNIPSPSGPQREIVLTQQEAFAKLPAAMRSAFGVHAPGIDEELNLSEPAKQALATTVVTQARLRGDLSDLVFWQPTADGVQLMSDQQVAQATADEVLTKGGPQ